MDAPEHDICVDQVYVRYAGLKRPRHRRILGVIDGHVVYSVGGDDTRICTLETFLKWSRKAELSP